MILVDISTLGIPDDQIDSYTKAFEIEYPNATIISDHATALSWIKFLTSNSVFQHLQIVCDEDAFPFWGRIPLVIEIISFAGKKCSKSFRSTDDETWIIRHITGARTKAQIKREGENPANTSKLLEATDLWNQISPVDTDLGKVDGDYRLVSEDTFDEAVADLTQDVILNGTYFAWDTETEEAGEDDTGAPNPYTSEIVGLSASTHAGSGYYFPIGHRDPVTDERRPENLSKDRILAAAIAILQRANPPSRITHNGKYDHSVLAAPAQGIPAELIYELLDGSHDTMLMAAVANYRSAKLKELAQDELGATVIDFKKLTGGKSFAYVPLDAATVYACQDADWTGQLFPIIKERLEELDVWHVYEEIELPIVEYFMRMERNGFQIDTQVFKARSREFQRKLDKMRATFLRICESEGLTVPEDFNVNSNEQVAALLFDPRPDGLGLPVYSRTSTNAPSTNKKAFNKLISEGINPPLMQLLRMYRDAFKLFTSYIEPMITKYVQEDDRVRASVHQLGAATGRTSITDPPLQTLPSEVRDAFIPEVVRSISHLPSGRPNPFDKRSRAADRYGELASLDYSQIELRVMAAVSGEPRMLSAFRAWKDIHESTRADVGLRTRTLAKNFNFGVGFGAGPPTLSETAGIPLADAQAFYDQYWDTYQRLREYMFDEQIPFVFEHGFAETWSGRKRLVDEARTIWEESSTERLAMNTPIQGGALDIMKIAMGSITKILPDMEINGINPINMVHDELDFERHPDTPPDVFRYFMNKTARIMERVNPWPDLLTLPVDITYGRNWAECK